MLQTEIRIGFLCILGNCPVEKALYLQARQVKSKFTLHGSVETCVQGILWIFEYHCKLCYFRFVAESSRDFHTKAD